MRSFMKTYEINPYIRFAQEILLQKSTNVTLTYDHRLFYILDGNGSIEIKNSQYTLSRGTVILIPSGNTYRFNVCKAIKIIALNFDYTQKYNNISSFINTVKQELYNQENILEKICFSDTPILNSPIVILDMHDVRRHLEHIIEEYRKGLLYSNELSSAIFKEVVIRILRFAMSSSSSVYDKIICIIKYIEENYSKNISNDELAKISGYHPYHLNRLMNEYTHTSIHKYLMNYRLRKSAEYLINTDLSISEISNLCGFKSPYYFSNLFKERIGISPLKFRKQQKNKI